MNNFFSKPAICFSFSFWWESNLTSKWNWVITVIIPLAFVFNSVSPYLVGFFKDMWPGFYKLMASSVIFSKNLFPFIALKGYTYHYTGMGLKFCTLYFKFFKKKKEDAAIYLQRSRQAACSHLYRHICLLKLLIN